jgi:hypothetical protein
MRYGAFRCPPRAAAVLSKIGVSSRTAAAREADRMGIGGPAEAYNSQT